MALYSVSVLETALVAATAKSILEIAASSTRRTKIVEWWLDFDGSSAAAVPIPVEVQRFSAAVTTATSITPDQFDAGDAAYSGVVKHSTTVEGAGTPTAGSGWIKHIHPQGGFHYQAPLGRELIIPKSGFFRIRCTAAANVNVNFGCILEE